MKLKCQMAEKSYFEEKFVSVRVWGGGGGVKEIVVIRSRLYTMKYNVTVNSSNRDFVWPS